MAINNKPLIAYGWLRAILCFIFFIIVYVLLSAIAGSLVNPKPGSDAPQIFAPGSVGNLLLMVLIVDLSFLLSAWLFRKFIDKKTFFSLGFQWEAQFAGIGLLTALGVIGIGSLLLWLIGDLKIIGTQFDPGSFLFNILLFLIVAAGEELFFRGYILNNLLQSFNKWIALAASALLFMLVHLDNPGATESLLPLLSAFFGGILFGINYIYTKNLWYGICLHFAWNYLQGPILGYDVSGTTSKPILIHSLSGPPLITGGAFGYEGSIVCVLLTVTAICVLILLFNRKAFVLVKEA
jgi:membrane protease YdiL (CAAX protease family)